MKITFRMDDIAPDMNWRKFNEFREMFQFHNVKPLIGIIPDNKDEELKYSNPNNEFWNIMNYLKNDGWVIAQHGFQHKLLSKDGGILKINNKSEFAGLAYTEQYEMIKKGKEILDYYGLCSDIFMAPAHSFDLNTLRALKENSFRYLTDGYTFYPYDFQGLKFLPCQISRPINIPFGLITVCLHSNIANERTFIQINSFISKYRNNVINYSDAIKMKSKNIINPQIERSLLLMRQIKNLFNR